MRHLFKKIIFFIKYLPLDILLFIKGVKIKVLKSKEDFEKVYKFRKKIFLQAGYINAEDVSDAWRDEYDDYAVNIAAFKNSEVTGAVRIIPRNEEMRFPLERCFRLKNKLPERSAEISKLAIDKEYRGGKRWILFGLMKKVFNECLKNKIEYWIAVMPENLHNSYKRAGVSFDVLETIPPGEEELRERNAIKLRGYFEQKVIPYCLSIKKLL